MAPAFLTPVSQNLQKLAANPALMQRLLLVGILWGSVAFAWGSITENALTNRLPTLFSHASRSAAEVSSYLERSTDILTPLTEDPRLILGLTSEEGLKSTQLARALYEFSYLNKLNNVWIYSALQDETTGLASAGTLPDSIRTWPKTLPAGSGGSAIVIPNPEHDGSSPYAYYIAKPIPGSNGGITLARLSWQTLLKNWPARSTIAGFEKAQQGLLGTGGTSKLWLPLGNSAEAQEQAWFTPTAKQTDYLNDVQTGTVWVWATVPNQGGWRIAIRTPLGNAVGEGRGLQWLLLLGSLAATAALLWQPTRTVRKKASEKIRRATAPVRAATVKALGPAFNAAKNVRNTLQKEKGVSLAQPGQFDAHDFKAGGKPRSSGSGGAAPKVVSVRRANPDAATPSGPALNLQPKKNEPSFRPDQAPTVNQLLGHKEDPKMEITPSLEEMVDQAILNRRVKLLFQPIYELGTGLPVYHEVLARLGDAQGNWMTPQVFIPVLQKNKWLPRLDALVFGRILTDYGTKTRPETPLTLNISGATMDNIRYLSKVNELRGVPVMQNLMFEVSSQELLADPSIIKLLMGTKSAGVKLAVDYFGGGTQMLETSKNIGFDFVKINTMKFSQDDAGKKDLIVLCRTAQRIGLPVVLEKIETVAMEIFARKLNVSYLQGYQLSRPMDSLTTAALPSWRANSALEQSEELTAQTAPESTPTS